MQGCEHLRVLPPLPVAEPLAALPTLPHEEEFETSTWTLHTPPLRYDVASLQHWLDLNA